MKNLSDQQKGSLLAFIGVFFITPDSLFIRLSNIDTWGMLFYRGAIPFFVVLTGLLIFYKNSFFKVFFSMGVHGIFYSLTFALTNITFIISIQNTNVANTLVMIAMAPMLTALLGAIFLKERPDKKTLTAIFVTFLSAVYIFYDSLQLGNFIGDLFGLVTALGLAIGAVIVRSAKSKDLVPGAVAGKFCVAIFALFFIESFDLIEKDIILVTIAPRYISAAEVNLFFLLETILGPIWVWLIIKEQPSLETIQGGTIIILTIAIHSFFKLKKS